MTQKFKEFKLWEIADLFYGNKYDKNKMTHNNPKVNFVSRTAKNNGVTDVVDKTDQQPFEQGALTLAFGGSVGSCFLQTEPFYTGQNVGVIVIPNVSENAKLYVKTCLEKRCKQEFVAFSYEINRHFKTDLAVYLPIDESTGEPDWVYMDRYIQEIEDRYIQEIENYFEVAGIDSAELTDDEKEILQKIPKFHEFRIGDLFDIHPTNAYKKTNRELYKLKGSTRVLSNTCEDNGTGGKCGLEPTETAGVITFSDTTTGPNTMFYQPTDFIGYPHVQGMYFTSGVLSENIGLYLVSVMKRSSGNAWSYARKYTREHVSNLRILLPIDSNNKPNWDYMYKYTEVTKKIAIARYANSEERKIQLAKKILNDKNH